MTSIVAVLALAIIVEGFVEYFLVPLKGLYKRYGAAIVGILACFGFGIDLFSLLGFHAVYPWVGIFATGILISRGSNYLNDLLSRINLIHLPAASVAAVTEANEGHTLESGGPLNLSGFSPSWSSTDEGTYQDPWHDAALPHAGGVPTQEEHPQPPYLAAVRTPLRPATDEEIEADRQQKARSYTISDAISEGSAPQVKSASLDTSPQTNKEGLVSPPEIH